jgi:chromosome segregation ATPase
MEEIIQLKDEAEQKILTLEKQLETGTCSNDLLKENENLKDTIKLLEMERKSSKNACEQALKVLDSGLSLEELNQELKLKQAEIEKLKGREQHFKESNEIFQQKLLLLTEENRKLKGQRPLNHY